MIAQTCIDGGLPLLTETGTFERSPKPRDSILYLDQIDYLSFARRTAFQPQQRLRTASGEMPHDTGD